MTTIDKTADLAGPGIGDYAELERLLADLRAENIVIDGLVLAEADLEQVFLHIMKGEGAAVPAGVR